MIWHCLYQGIEFSFKSNCWTELLYHPSIITALNYQSPLCHVKEEHQEKSYFHVKEGGFVSYLVFAFIEKRNIEDDLLFFTTATMVTSTISAIIAKGQN